MPKEKAVEARRQTQHKLNLMERYWAAWSAILAQARGRRFCPDHLWVIDALAGSGLHESQGDPDGVTAGTPLLAVHAARAIQRAHPPVAIHVRAIDINRQLAFDLEALASRYRGDPPDGVDVVVYPEDFRGVTSRILEQIRREDHPHGGRDIGAGHAHRSLWFFDPFGLEPIEHSAIDGLGHGSEVIVNLDTMAIIRHAGKALKGDRQLVDLLDEVYGGPGWRRVALDSRRERHLAFAQDYASTFGPAYRFRNVYPLRATGSQDRFMVHLTNAPKAVPTFAEDYKVALTIGTAAAGQAMSQSLRASVAKQLFERHRGDTLSPAEMRQLGAPYNLGQLRAICSVADQRELGRWDAKAGRMRWFLERGVDPDRLTLGF